MREGSGYALGPSGLLALGIAGFLLFVAIGFMAARPAEPAEAPENSAPAPKPAAGVEPAPTLDEAAALPALAHRRPPAVRRRARWRREGESFDRAQRSARLAVRRAVALAEPDPVRVPAARPLHRPSPRPPRRCRLPAARGPVPADPPTGGTPRRPRPPAPRAPHVRRRRGPRLGRVRLRGRPVSAATVPLSPGSATRTARERRDRDRLARVRRRGRLVSAATVMVASAQALIALVAAAALGFLPARRSGSRARRPPPGSLPARPRRRVTTRRSRRSCAASTASTSSSACCSPTA